MAPGIHATFVDAGHILGSAIIRLRVADRDGGPERPDRLLGRPRATETPILRDPTIVTDADYVLVESTYGGREHEPEAESTRILAETVRLVAEHDGVLLVPSFAIGRTQEVVWELDRLITAGKIPLLPLYLDSPMASKASGIYRAHPDYYDAETRDLLARHESPLDYPNQIVTNDVRAVPGDRAGAAAVHDRRLERHADRRPRRRPPAQPDRRPGAVLLFVGYQGDGHAGSPSPGRRRDRPDRRPGPAGPLPGPLDQRLLGPRRRVRAARLARRRSAAGKRPGDDGLPAAGLPRPRRPRRPGGPAPEGPGARLRRRRSQPGTSRSSCA